MSLAMSAFIMRVSHGSWIYLLDGTFMELAEEAFDRLGGGMRWDRTTVRVRAPRFCTSMEGESVPRMRASERDGGEKRKQEHGEGGLTRSK